MALNETIAGAVAKKTALLRNDGARFAARAVLAGAYLTLGTAFAAIVGHNLNAAVGNTAFGATVFGLLFGLGLYCIIILNADLATSNMMYMSYGSVKKQVSWGRGFSLVTITTAFNLVGAVLIAAALGYSARFNGFDQTHLISTLVDGKLDKGPIQVLVEASVANFVVNMAVVGQLFAKDLVSKFFTIVPIIAIFVVLGLEHVIANFSLMTVTFFASDFDASRLPTNWSAGGVGLNWLMAFIGNYIGGGLLIGSVYAWLNNSKGEVYRD